MDHFLLTIIVLSLVAFVSICFSKPTEREHDDTEESALAQHEENELVQESEKNLPVT